MDSETMHQKVVVIRLPANFQTGRTSTSSGQAAPTTAVGTNNNDCLQLADINQIPDEVIAEMVSNQYKQQQQQQQQQQQATSITVEDNGVAPNIMIDNSDPKQMVMYSLDHPELAPTLAIDQDESIKPPSRPTNTYSREHSINNTTNNDDCNISAMNNAIDAPNSTGESNARALGEKQSDEHVQYKNYSPKQREWMLVVLSYSRGLLAKPFEMKLQDVVIEKARDVLRENAATFNMTNRIPTPKTLRGIWKNLWKHPDKTVGTVKKGGRPRIDPAIKRQKRNEREKRRRAALKQKKETGTSGGNVVGGENSDANQAGTSGADYYYQTMQQQQHPAAPRRSRRGQ